MRLAFFSPLNPKRSGISDYSEELLPYLAPHAEIDLVTDGFIPSDSTLSSRHRVLFPPAFIEQAGRYDAVVYQIGNSLEYHGYMVPCLAQVPGIVVLHDYSLGYLTLGLTLARGDRASVERMLARTVTADEARRITRQLLLGRLDSYTLSLARPIIEMSTGVIVHNQFAYDRLGCEYPSHPLRKIWHPTPIREQLGDSASLRRLYGFDGGDFLIVSVSRLAYNKRLDLALSVLSRAVRENPSVRLILVGEGDLGDRGRRLIAREGLAPYVRQTGWVTAQQYIDYIDMADAAIDLRHPTAGETSGGSLRLLQAGKPIVATAQGFFLEVPSNCCFVIHPNSPGEEDQVLDALRRLWSAPLARAEMGRRARDFALANLRREQAAQAYIDFISGVVSQPPVTHQWPLPGHDRSNLTKMVYNWGRILTFTKRYGLSALFSRIRSGTHG